MFYLFELTLVFWIKTDPEKTDPDLTLQKLKLTRKIHVFSFQIIAIPTTVKFLQKIPTVILIYSQERGGAFRTLLNM